MQEKEGSDRHDISRGAMRATDRPFPASLRLLPVSQALSSLSNGVSGMCWSKKQREHTCDVGCLIRNYHSIIRPRLQLHSDTTLFLSELLDGWRGKGLVHLRGSWLSCFGHSWHEDSRVTNPRFRSYAGHRARRIMRLTLRGICVVDKVPRGLRTTPSRPHGRKETRSRDLKTCHGLHVLEGADEEEEDQWALTS